MLHVVIFTDESQPSGLSIDHGQLWQQVMNSLSPKIDPPKKTQIAKNRKALPGLKERTITEHCR